jgi:hypothetical protein
MAENRLKLSPVFRNGTPPAHLNRRIPDRRPLAAGVQNANTETSLIRRFGYTPSRASIETSITITRSCAVGILGGSVARRK